MTFKNNNDEINIKQEIDNKNKNIINENNLNENNNNIDFWIKNPKILLDSNYITELWFTNNMSKNQKLNAISRLIILLTIISYAITKNIKILISGIITIIALICINYLDKNNESFSNIRNKINTKLDKIYLNSNYFTQSNIKNPLANVQPNEFTDNPKRKDAAPSYNKKVEEQINNNTKKFIQKNFNDKDIDKKLFNDLGDNLQFENSMRQFYSTSSTTIPNDQESFLKFCYSNMGSCKDGDVDECIKKNYRHVRN